MIRDSKRRHKRNSVSISEGGVRITQIRLRSTTKTTGVNALRSALRLRQRIMQALQSNWAKARSFPAQGGCRP